MLFYLKMNQQNCFWRVLNKLLKTAGLKFEIYSNGEVLIKRLEELKPNDIVMVLTDIEMPGTDGYQVASYVKSNKKFEKTLTYYSTFGILILLPKKAQ